MDEPTTNENKVVKAWRLRPDIVRAIKDAWPDHEYPNETAYVEAIFCRVLGLPEPVMPKPKPPRISKKAMALRA
jgi:hypothetical protein